MPMITAMGPLSGKGPFRAVGWLGVLEVSVQLTNLGPLLVSYITLLSLGYG